MEAAMGTLECKVFQRRRASLRSWKNMIDMKERRLPHLKDLAVRTPALVASDNGGAKMLGNR